MGDPNRKRSAAELAVLKRLRAVCADLPGITESRDGFGHSVLKVGTKSIAILGEDDGEPSLAIKTDLQTQAALIKRSSFFKTPYVGQHGWVSTRGNVKNLDWESILDVLLDTYRSVAPKKLLEQLEARR